MKKSTFIISFLLTLLTIVGNKNTSAQVGITLKQAEAVLAAAHLAAVEQGTLMNIAVVDRTGLLKAFSRMISTLKPKKLYLIFYT